MRTAIARGVETGLFAYTTGRPALGDDGCYRGDRGRITFERALAEDEIDLDSGFLIAPAALPRPDEFAPLAVAAGDDGGDDDASVYPTPGGGASVTREESDGVEKVMSPAAGSRDVTISFSADRDKLFHAWSALANLADAAGRVSVSVKATSDAGFDKAKIENGVLEPLRELGLIDDTEVDR